MAQATGNAAFAVWADLDGTNHLQTRYVRGDAVDQLFARIGSDGTAYWELTDRLGSVREVTDNSGVLKDALTYDGFGNITTETGSSFRGRYAWTGREFDTEDNLQYNHARHYDPSTGRWTSQDPLGFDAGDSNLYRYVRNQSTSLTDPSGELYVIESRAGFKVGFELSDQKKPMRSDIIANGQAIAHLAIYPNISGTWQDHRFGKAPRNIFGPGARNGQYPFEGGIAMEIRPVDRTISQSDFTVVQTLYMVVNVLQDDPAKGRIWRPEKVELPDFNSSLSIAEPGINYYVDGTPATPVYPLERSKVSNTALFFDYPTVTLGAIDLAREQFPSAVGVSSQVFFTTYILYKKAVVAVVPWTVSSTWYPWYSCTQANSNLDILHLRVSAGPAQTDFQSSPISAGERDAIKKRYPGQRFVEID
jgi:RHS repeat-associated protein